jgi:quercetin dioxygenase-like cupin family protein
MSNEEIVFETENTKVRIIELSAKAGTAWHYHTEVTDNCFCLEGSIDVHFKKPDRTISLQPGERCTIETGEIHRVANGINQKSKYLLVQGVGKYDFIESNL